MKDSRENQIWIFLILGSGVFAASQRIRKAF
jgi:hypothetical protein